MVDHEKRLFDRLDQNMRRQIVNFLRHRGIRNLHRVEINVAGGTVVLQGRVNSFYEKQLCLNCSQRIPGVLKIIDKLEVKSSAGTAKSLR